MTNPVGTAAHQVLVVYGVPARMKLRDGAGRELGRTFSLTTDNRASFERALRIALTRFLAGDAQVMGARFVFIRNATDLAAAFRTGTYSQVVYYGHALEGSNALLPRADARITATQLSQALEGTSVQHFDILGCKSSAITAELATLSPGLKVGNLRAARQDNIEVDPRTLAVIAMSIDSQPLFHFGANSR